MGRYGDITKTVPTPKTDTIAAMKAEIEKSKVFLDSLKKGKVKDPECVVKPQIRMQKKGVADYKGVFPSLEAARASNKVICLIPSRDGQTYEMRLSELGEFIAPKHKITEFSDVRAGFRPALPRIPQELLRSIIGFFRSQMESSAEFEALVRIYWDRKDQKFIPFVPKQCVTKDRVTVRMTDEDLPDECRYLYYADIHSHNSMKAIFSAIDDQDERGTRLYLVIGRLDRFFPEISARISCGGSFVPIEPSLVLEGVAFPRDGAARSSISFPNSRNRRPHISRAFVRFWADCLEVRDEVCREPAREDRHAGSRRHRRAYRTASVPAFVRAESPRPLYPL